MPHSLQIGTNNVQQTIGRLGVKGARMSVGVDQMRPHMVLDYFRHEPCHGAACAGDQMHDLLASRLGFEGPFNPLYLSSNTAYPRQQLLLVANRMAHAP
jgi:hypothetical protein